MFNTIPEYNPNNPNNPNLNTWLKTLFETCQEQEEILISSLINFLRSRENFMGYLSDISFYNNLMMRISKHNFHDSSYDKVMHFVFDSIDQIEDTLLKGKILSSLCFDEKSLVFFQKNEHIKIELNPCNFTSFFTGIELTNDLALYLLNKKNFLFLSFVLNCSSKLNHNVTVLSSLDYGSLDEDVRLGFLDSLYHEKNVEMTALIGGESKKVFREVFKQVRKHYKNFEDIHFVLNKDFASFESIFKASHPLAVLNIKDRRIVKSLYSICTVYNDFNEKGYDFNFINLYNKLPCFLNNEQKLKFLDWARGPEGNLRSYFVLEKTIKNLNLLSTFDFLMNKQLINSAIENLREFNFIMDDISHVFRYKEMIGETPFFESKKIKKNKINNLDKLDNLPNYITTNFLVFEQDFVFSKKTVQGFKVEVPKNAMDLIELGKSLDNCVGDFKYSYLIYKNQSNIIYLSKNGRPKYCIEIRDKEVSQFLGRKNRPAPQELISEVEYLLKNPVGMKYYLKFYVKPFCSLLLKKMNNIDMLS